METRRSGVVLHTWGNFLSCTPELLFTPKNEGELREILQAAWEKHKHVRVVGRSHSRSGLQFCPEYVVNIEHMNQVLQVDKINSRVTVEGGITISQLNQELDKHGLALSVMSVVSDVTLAGAIMTGTHGSGGKFGSVGSYVTAFDIMLASGEVQSCSNSKNKELFKAGVCSLGALGVVMRVTLQCEPAFCLAMTQYSENTEKVLDALDEQVASCDHFTMMGFPHTDMTLVSYASRVNTPPPPPAEKSVTGSMWMYAVSQCAEFLLWMSTFFPWLMPYINNFLLTMAGGRKEVIDSSYKIFERSITPTQYVSEWAIPVEAAVDTIRRINTWIVTNKFPAPFPLVVRFVKADDLWLSPAYGRDTCTVQALVTRPKATPYRKYFEAVAEIVKDVGGRPHWAKHVPEAAQDLRGLYPKWDDFLRLQKTLDPRGMFLNNDLERIFGVSSHY